MQPVADVMLMFEIRVSNTRVDYSVCYSLPYRILYIIVDQHQQHTSGNRLQYSLLLVSFLGPLVSVLNVHNTRI